MDTTGTCPTVTPEPTAVVKNGPSEAQIRANQQNALRSTGPRTVEGKERSRGNATTHGLTGSGVVTGAKRQEEVAARVASWSTSLNLVNDHARWALEQAVLASFRLDDCNRAFDGLGVESRNRAALVWDGDRRVEVLTLAQGLSRRPERVARELESSLHGASLLIERWTYLMGVLDDRDTWSESEISTALDLLGVATDARLGRTRLDQAESHRSLAEGEIKRLTSLIESALQPLDAIERNHTIHASRVFLSKPAALILRYEREANRRYESMMSQIKRAARSESATTPTPTPTPAPASTPAPSAALASVARTAEALETRRILATEFVDHPLGPQIAAAQNRMESAESDAELEEAQNEVIDLLNQIIHQPQPSIGPRETSIERPAPVQGNRRQRRAAQAMARSR